MLLAANAACTSPGPRKFVVTVFGSKPFDWVALRIAHSATY
ncbi:MULTISPECIES: hypothetical protein [Mesorhizobium]|nr:MULTISPECIES: hypothetical protein [Mesorhizobium]